MTLTQAVRRRPPGTATLGLGRDALLPGSGLEPALAGGLAGGAPHSVLWARNGRPERWPSALSWQGTGQAPCPAGPRHLAVTPVGPWHP